MAGLEVNYCFYCDWPRIPCILANDSMWEVMGAGCVTQAASTYHGPPTITAKNLWNAVKSSHKYPLGTVSAGKTAHQRNRLSIAHKWEVFIGHEPQNHISLPIDFFLFYSNWPITQRSSATLQECRKSTLIWWEAAKQILLWCLQCRERRGGRI